MRLHFQVVSMDPVVLSVTAIWKLTALRSLALPFVQKGHSLDAITVAGGRPHRIEKRQVPTFEPRQTNVTMFDIFSGVMQGLFPTMINGTSGGSGLLGFIENIFGPDSGIGRFLQGFIAQMQMIFRNISQMWMGVVDRQVTRWNQMQPRRDSREFEMINKLVKDAHATQDRLEQFMREQQSPLKSARMVLSGRTGAQDDGARTRMADIEGSIKRIWFALRDGTQQVYKSVIDGENNWRVMAANLQRELNRLWDEIAQRLLKFGKRITPGNKAARDGDGDLGVPTGPTVGPSSSCPNCEIETLSSAGANANDADNEIEGAVKMVEKIQRQADKAWLQNDQLLHSG